MQSLLDHGCSRLSLQARRRTMDAAANDDDALAYRLLGWPAEESEGGANITARQWNNDSNNEEDHNDDGGGGDEDWLTLQLLLRSTDDNGLTTFRRAMQIVYADIKPPCFFCEKSSSSSCRSDEIIVWWRWKIKAYFRLIRYALERPETTAAKETTTTHPMISSSANSLSEDGWEKMAIELLKRMNISLQQFLMELSQCGSSGGSRSSDSTTTTETTLSSSLPTMTTITTTSSSTLMSTNNEKNRYDTSSFSSSSSTIILHYLQSILNIICPHIQQRIRLLGPTYRSVCEISESFVSLMEKDKLTMAKVAKTFTSLLSTTPSEEVAMATTVGMVGWKTLSTLLHEDMEQLRSIWNKCQLLLERMTYNLLGFLDEGLDRIQTTLLTRREEQQHHHHQNLDKSSSLASAAAAEKQSKIIVFLLARITSLITMIVSGTYQFSIEDERCVTTTSSNRLGSVVSEGCGGGSSLTFLMTQFIQRLVRACHLSLLAQSFLVEQDENSHSSNLPVQRGVERAPYLRMVEELRPRVERYLIKVMGDFDSKHHIAHRVGLESFNHMTSSFHDEANCWMSTDSLGKFHLMKVIMKKLVVADPCMLPEPIIMMKFYQSILFVDIPNCHRFFQFGCNVHRQALGILQELVIVLENVSHILYRSWGGDEISSMTQQQQQQHYLLVSWLSPVSGRNGTPMTVTNHPLTSEVLLNILHRRILLSCALNDRYSQDDTSHLLSLLTQLLFNQQTETFHRRNIATLLTRLLSSASVKELTCQSLWRSLNKACILNSTQQKRQRKPFALAAGDVGVICVVLEALTSSRKHIHSEASSELRQFWEEVMGNTFTRSIDVTRATFLVSLSVGVMRSSSTLADFFLACGRDATVSCHVVTPSDFTERFLAFIQPMLLRRQSKSCSASARIVLLTTVSIHLLDAMCQCVGFELPEVQIDKIGSFLLDAVVSASANASFYAIGLQYCALSSVSKLGSTIRSNYGDVTLKPLAGIVNHLLDKESWYYIAPTISCLNYFVQALPNNHKGIVKTIPSLAGESSLARLLFTSRLKGVIFSITSRATIDLTEDMPLKESRFLIDFCRRVVNDAWCNVGCKSIILKNDSKVIVHRDKQGEVVAVIIAPTTGNDLSSSGILSAVTNSKFDVHFMSSNCELKLSSPTTTQSIAEYM